MSLFDQNNKNSKSSPIDETIANSLRDLIELLKNVTEFKPNELKAISLLQTDEYLKNMLDFYILNKKHIKRKHSKEILEAIKYLSEALQVKQSENQFYGMLPNARRR